MKAILCCGRVGLAVNGLQRIDGYVRVDGCRLQCFVAEKLLDAPDAGPALPHVGGAGVADQVTTAGGRGAELFCGGGKRPLLVGVAGGTMTWGVQGGAFLSRFAH
jgi:hypothetical protein